MKGPIATKQPGWSQAGRQANRQGGLGKKSWVN